MKYRIIIVNVRNIFGGTIVLSALGKYLREVGVDARIFYTHDFPRENTNMFLFWCRWFVYSVKYHILSLIYRLLKGTRYVNTSRFRAFEYIPVKGIKEQYIPFFSRRKTIVVYPEVLYGNFLHAKNVVRWLLYHYKWSNDTKAYGKDDLFVCYRELFNDWQLNPEGYKVHILHFDSDLYRQYNFGDREGNCYIIRKGAQRADLPTAFDGPIIDGLKESEIVEIFNKYKYCYCYDMQSFYARIAAVCGCIPILVPEPGKTQEDYFSEEERNTPGIAWGDIPEEIEYAIKTRHKLLEDLDYTSHNNVGVKMFINLISQKFN